MDKIIEKMFSVGAHFGYSKTKRHPSVKKFIFGAKNKVEIFDLEKTVKSLEDAKTFAKDLAASGKQILFVSSKMEAKETIENGASSVAAPFVAGRWIGGTLTNSTEIRKRVTKFLKLESDKEKGLLAKYTKKERLLIDREIDKLSRKFSGLTSMEGMPGALFVVDPKKEEIAVTNSDCNIKNIKYTIAANDSAMASIKFFTDEIVEAYGEGKKSAPKKEVVKREFSRR